MKSTIVPFLSRYLDLPSISGKGARILGESISSCDVGCRRTANLEDVSNIDEEYLSSKDLTFCRHGCVYASRRHSTVAVGFVLPFLC